MKELFVKLSEISDFFKEKRFIFVGETQNSLEPPPFNPENSLEPPPFTPQAAEKLAADFKKIGDDVFTQAKIENRFTQIAVQTEYGTSLADKALAEAEINNPRLAQIRREATKSLSALQNAGEEDRSEALAKEATKSLSGLGTPEEVSKRISGGKKEENTQIAYLDLDNTKS